MAGGYIIDNDVDGEEYKVLPENEIGISIEIIPRRILESEPPWFRRSYLINKNMDVTNYYRIKLLADICDVLSDSYTLVDRFLEGPFGHFLNWQPGQNNKKLLNSIISRCIVTEQGIWFHIRGKDVEYTIQDHALITGLRFGPTLFDPRIQRHPSESHLFQVVCGGINRNAAWLNSQLKELTSANDPDGEVRAKLSNLLMANCFILGHEAKANVFPWLWEFIDDEDEFNGFPWGPYTYKTLQYYLRMFQTTSKKYHIYGPSWALMIWALEVMTGFGDDFEVRCPTNHVPRCLRWNFLNTFRGVSDDELHAPFEYPEGQISMIHPEDQEIQEGYFLSVLQPRSLMINFHVPNSPYIVIERPRVRRSMPEPQHAERDDHLEPQHRDTPGHYPMRVHLHPVTNK